MRAALTESLNLRSMVSLSVYGLLVGVAGAILVAGWRRCCWYDDVTESGLLLPLPLLLTLPALARLLATASSADDDGDADPAFVTLAFLRGRYL